MRVTASFLSSLFPSVSSTAPAPCTSILIFCLHAPRPTAACARRRRTMLLRAHVLTRTCDRATGYHFVDHTSAGRESAPTDHSHCQ